MSRLCRLLHVRGLWGWLVCRGEAEWQLTRWYKGVQGFGVCCLFFTSSCGSTINQNITYLQNPGYPSGYSTAASTQCEYRITKVGFILDWFYQSRSRYRQAPWIWLYGLGETIGYQLDHWHASRVSRLTGARLVNFWQRWVRASPPPFFRLTPTWQEFPLIWFDIEHWARSREFKTSQSILIVSDGLMKENWEESLKERTARLHRDCLEELWKLS